MTSAAEGAGSFYLPESQEQLSQGDLFLVPTSVLWSHDSRPDALAQVPPIPPRVGATVFTHAWDPAGAGEAGAPATVIEARWGAAMVLSHNCEIDKDFNEAVDRLVAEEGLDDDEAMRRASHDWDLDRYIVVAPLLSYGEIAAHRHEGIRSGQRIGYFPLPPIPGFGTSDFAVHLSRVSTVERRLLRTGLKVASLATASGKRLQYKIAEVFASRRLTLLSEIEAAVGREIVQVKALKESRRKVTVALELDDGTDLHLETRPTPGSAAPERLRRAEK